jgi:hypothetical protein
MTAANHKYYAPLLETIKNLQSFFPDFVLIIYDLGLKPSNLNKVNKKKYLEYLFFLI